MGRPLRIEYPGAFYHITSRGNERKAIFQDKKDYERFKGYLESATERYGARIHCFCFMSNHYHLLLETPRGNLHQILHQLNTSYTNYFNVRAKRVGHLFQGRYRAILVDKDAYALELSRYIHLNPVRAHVVQEPSAYQWSSFKDYIGERKDWEWLCTEWILGQMSSNERRARGNYRKFVEEGIGKTLQDPLHNVIGSTVLGSEKFVEWVRDKWIQKRQSHRDIPALRELTKWPRLPYIVEEAEKVFGKEAKNARNAALYLAHRFSGCSLGEIGNYFGGIGPSAVSQHTRRFEQKLRGDKKLAQEIDKLKKILSE
jgi:REP element-mobilizing transposase RayT